MKHEWIIKSATDFLKYIYNKLYMKLSNAIKREKGEITIRIEQGRATGFARGKNDEARELLRIFQVHTRKRVSFFILVVRIKRSLDLDIF